MSSERERTYFGVCTRLRDGTACVEVRGQFDGSAVRDLSQSSRNLFPPHGEVELRPGPTQPVHRGDWIAFGAESHGPPGHLKYRAVYVCNLPLLEDLTAIGDPEAIRRLLVEEGLAESAAGWRYLRIGECEMVRVTIAQDPDGFWRASAEPDVSRLPIFECRPELCIPANDGAKPVTLLDARLPFRQIGTTNWSSDADVLRKIIAAMRDKTDADDTARRQFADALSRYADQLEPNAPAADRGFDPFAARRILRFHRIASVLRERQEVLQEYLDFLKSDPEVKALIDGQIAAAVEQQAAAQRDALREVRELELDREIGELRAKRQFELEKSIGELGTEMMSDLEKRADARSAEIDRHIAELEKQGLAELEASLGARRASMQDEVRTLEERRSALASETAGLQKTRDALGTEIRGLTEEQNRATEIVERWTSVAAALGTAADSFAVTRTSVPAPEPATGPSPQRLRASDLEQAVAACSLLTDAGKEMLTRLVALMVAGEIPLLHGGECEDFIEIARSLVSGGRLARLEADPTIISFDDLWIRPGTQVATPLRLAAADAAGEAPRNSLCMISRADLSGARFWYPALADRSGRGQLPPGLLICATLDDPESEESSAFAKSAILLEAKDLIAPKAATVAPAMLAGPRAKLFDLEVVARPTDLTGAVAPLASMGITLGIRDAERVARIFAAAGMLMKAAQAEELARSAALRFSGIAPSAASGGNVIPLGGSARA
jgi:hypothetical protein